MAVGKLHILRAGTALSLALAPFLAGGAVAADTGPPPAEAEPIQEIIVTATKRAESITKVPISMMALDQDTMTKQGVKDVSDLARLVPGLNLQANDDDGDTSLSIRGIVSDVGAATVGVYIDDAPVQSRQEAVSTNPYPKVFDLDRVEVLRGPQGTLFGAGSEGGTLRFITPEAGLQKFSGSINSEVAVTDGGGPSWELGGAFGGPLVEDKVGFRASGWFREDGGYTNRLDPATHAVTATDTNSSGSTVGLHPALPEPLFQQLQKVGRYRFLNHRIVQARQMVGQPAIEQTVALRLAPHSRTSSLLVSTAFAPIIGQYNTHLPYSTEPSRRSRAKTRQQKRAFTARRLQ